MPAPPTATQLSGAAGRGRRAPAARRRGRPCGRRRPAGAASVTGAKFRMLRTPAAASRSQTAWATSAGVVMTPIEACVAHDVLQLVDRPHGLPADPLADPRRGGVEEADELEASATPSRPPSSPGLPAHEGRIGARRLLGQGDVPATTSDHDGQLPAGVVVVCAASSARTIDLVTTSAPATVIRWTPS